MWPRVALLLTASVLVVVAALVPYGASRWGAATQVLRAALEAERLPPSPATYDARDLTNLPPPVRRYFLAVLEDGQPIVSVARLKQEGVFNRSDSAEQWSRFTASQVVTTRPPAFDWDARIAVAPALNVFVHDTYSRGEGRLHAAFLGLLSVADIRGTPEVAHGELLRFLAEAVWYPTALLPSQGVRWQALGDDSARATLTDGVTTASLDFLFDARGLATDVRAAARYRAVGSALVATPWHGRFWDYQTRASMRIPQMGEVAWETPQGSQPYWRGRITEISYDFAGAAP